MTKKVLRDNLLGTKPNYRSKTVTINDVEYQVRQMSLDQTNKLLAKTQESGNTGIASYIWSIIYSVHDPETGEQIFEESDYEQLLKQPSAGSFLEQFSDAIAEVSEGKETSDNSSPTKA